MTVEVWQHPDKCDCCGIIGDGSFSQENIYPPDMTFVWCPKCEKDTRACNEVIAKATKGYHDYIRRLKNEGN